MAVTLPNWLSLRANYVKVTEVRAYTIYDKNLAKTS